MEPKDYFKWKFPTLYNVWNGKNTDFSNRATCDYNHFISAYQGSRMVVLISDATKNKLQKYYDSKIVVAGVSSKPLLEFTQIGRWYANGFTSAYNYCKQYTMDKTLTEVDFTPYIEKLADVNEKSVASETKVRRIYVLNLGRIEGARFFMIENGTADIANKEDTASLQDISAQEVTIENISGLVEKNLAHKECVPRVMSKIKELVKSNKNKSIIGYCIICLKELNLTDSPDDVLKAAFRSDFFPDVEKRVFDASVNRILRSYRQRDTYSGYDKGEKWGVKRETLYQEVYKSLRIAMSFNSNTIS